jgi:hypothetical protein
MHPLHSTAAMILTPALYFALGVGLHFFDGFVNQPFPSYGLGKWFSDQLGSSIVGGVLLATVVGVLMVIDVCAQSYRGKEPIDLAYYPTLRGLRRGFVMQPSRLILAVGLLGLAAYYIKFQLDIRATEIWSHAMVWPPPYAKAGGLGLWALLWYADSLARPNRGTVFASTSFLLISLFVLISVAGMSSIRE